MNEVSTFDVANFFLNKDSLTPKKLQKLVYLCFADYLCDTGKELFTDKIYAFKYGFIFSHKAWKKCLIFSFILPVTSLHLFLG